ncbi:MAG TPA: MraY family glycosyltransferase [Verrucomicrobiae bacterium]
MEWIELIIGGLVGLATSTGLVLLILQASRRYGLAGRASEAHHTHKIPVPRLGGIALAGAMVSVILVFSFLSGPDAFLNSQRCLLITASLAMFGLGLWDDLFVLGARRKLLGQILIASVTYFCGIGIVHFRIPYVDQIINLGLWSWPITVIWLVAMTNLINLIDGVDGLAGGICLMLMMLLVYVSLHSGFVPIVAAGMAGALLGFLRFNFPPARIYMGDGGAYFLGFFIGAVTIVTSEKGTLFAALVAPLFVLALPIIDTSLAILRRGLRGLPLFRPDRKHIHHRLLATGYSRRTVVLGLYAFTAFFLMLGFLIFYWHGEHFPLFLGVGILTVMLTAWKFNFSREWFSIGRVLGNSLEARGDIHYAMSLSRWLALEGTRVQTLHELAGDVVFIARKLGFSSVQMRLEDAEKNWELTGTSLETRKSFQHKLPGHKFCFLELTVSCPDPKSSSTDADAIVTESHINTFQILSELLAEGWAKAVGDWQKRNQLPARFDARLNVPAAVDAQVKTTLQAAEKPGVS